MFLSPHPSISSSPLYEWCGTHLKGGERLVRMVSKPE